MRWRTVARGVLLISSQVAAAPTKVPPGDAPTVRASYDPAAVAIELDVARESVRGQLFPNMRRPETLGRYELVRRLGSGGMGLILVAYDPQLDREVAIKILRAGVDGGTDHERLLAEARAAARLSHPNVVAMHDVGVHDGRVFVAMELVRGVSFRSWLADHHAWREVLDILLQAGDGLMAAHEAGLVHRDFKPANMLVGDDGRVRVVDFGLARAASELPVDASLPDFGEQTLRSLYTMTGEVVGTPAYMAPEQWIGGTVDARADQFSFCVCLYEGLFGERPFEGGTLTAIREAVLGAPLQMPPFSDRLPPVIRSVLERGLSRRREDRYPDMTALLSELRTALPNAPVVENDEPEPPAPQPEGQSPLRGPAYLGQLPRGLDSHPQCLIDGGLVRLALMQAPIRGEILQQIEQRYPVGSDRWIPEACGRAILAEIFDAHFDSLSAYEAFSRRVVRARLASGFTRFLVPPSSSARAADALPRAWQTLHRGTPLLVQEAAPGFAAVVLQHPPMLLDDLGRADLAQTLFAAMEQAGARLIEAQATRASPDRVEARVRWG